MFVIAVTRWAIPVEEELPELAQLLGGNAYDLRLRLMGPLPVIVQRVEDEPAARALLASLRKRGHGAVACDLDKVMPADKMLSPREFSIDAEALEVPGVQDGRVPYDSILAMLPAIRLTSDSSTSTVTKRKLSLGRALMTGGLKPTRKKSKISHTQTDEREQVLYLYRKARARPLLLCELRLRYANLEEFMCASTAENFTALVTLLRKRAPGAIFDDRLAAQLRKTDSIDVSGTTQQRTITKSNASSIDLAAHLVLIAHISQQF